MNQEVCLEDCIPRDFDSEHEEDAICGLRIIDIVKRNHPRLLEAIQTDTKNRLNDREWCNSHSNLGFDYVNISVYDIIRLEVGYISYVMHSLLQ